MTYNIDNYHELNFFLYERLVTKEFYPLYKKMGKGEINKTDLERVSSDLFSPESLDLLLQEKGYEVDDPSALLKYFYENLLAGTLNLDKVIMDDFRAKRMDETFNVPGFRSIESVKRLLSSGVTEDNQVYDRIKLIEDGIKKGLSWENLISTQVFADDYASNWAFMEAVRSRYNEIPDTSEGLEGLLKLGPGKIPWLGQILTTDKIARYDYQVSKVVNEGGNLKDLMAVNPKDFGLPEKWVDPVTELPSNKDIVIKWNLFLRYGQDSLFRGLNLSHRDLADKLEAPLDYILEAMDMENILYGDIRAQG